ncbi:uncharacterized protein CcaverHIS019_0204990 [Cutaneotrichosporon cavernicola]|uniref:Uncharacterized protein n=1 Tax=Cutaneotrichosporon cavernicola TaxID=279322 RepID=A0AA48L1L4_9TREE|nr:uncharacterized protein CcaverHIS019_0204990 [Cutaneotrichosporon cavernicola]BEI89137.1 hypothetical protein CcaverHIS019_0204990 [Cutaneotrichosporon cavernicola]BEJ04686.1 hypothetical protein CcaverHIS641_0205030 [Cutaneotrichosporon cavernicola]
MTYHTPQPHPHILLTPPESPPQTSSYLEHPTPRAHTKLYWPTGPRSPIPEESEDALDCVLERMAPHHEDSLGTIRDKSSQRPPLSREKTPVRPPLVHHDDSGDTIHAEPMGKKDRESHFTDESREPVTQGQLHPPGHQHHHHHQRRKRGSQPRPLAPPRRLSAGKAVVPDEVPEAHVRAINVPKIVEHLCEVQAADVALVDSIMALDGKVDRLLEHFGVKVGAVGIHGKLDALIVAVGAEKRE